MSNQKLRFSIGVFLFLACWASSIHAAPNGLASSSSFVHPYHVSLAEIERNERSGNFEVSLCIWPADLEKALARMAKKPIDLDRVDNLDELIAKYIDANITFISGDGTQAKIRYVGCELDLQKGWLYFEVQTGQERDDWSYRNQFFFELNDDQINHFNFKKESGIQSDACTSANSTITLG